MIKRIFLVFLIATILTSCGQKTPTWQEQYDLGIRYLSEGKYEEAFISFTAAIEIDPNQALAYVGRGDAYVGSGETAENLASAQADYEKAIELDGTLAEVYIKLADVYIQQGDKEKALEILRRSLGNNGENDGISEKIKEIETAIELSEPWGDKRFDEYTPEQQQYIETLVKLIVQNERESAWNLLKDIEILNEEYTFSFAFHEYRIKICPKISDRSGGSIEIHPLEGRGFYCQYSEKESGGFDEEFVVGDCENWNWNGPFQHYWRYYIPDSDDTITVRSGVMRDGLLDGDVEDHTKRTFVGESASVPGWEKTDIQHYDMGVTTGFGDSTALYSAVCGFISVDQNKPWDWS